MGWNSGSEGRQIFCKDWERGCIKIGHGNERMGWHGGLLIKYLYEHGLLKKVERQKGGGQERQNEKEMLKKMEQC